jgi:type I restriction enzyme, S subunit
LTRAHEIRRLKYAVKDCVNGFWGDEPNGKDDLMVVRVADFDRKRGVASPGEEPTIRAIPLSARGRRLLSSGDLLIEKSGGGEQQPVGAVVIYNDDREAVCSNFVARLPVADDCDSRFVAYVFGALYSERRNVPHIKQTSGIQNLDSESYLSEQAWLPAKAVQASIASFLDEQTARIDALIAEKEALLVALEKHQFSFASHLMTRGLDQQAALQATGYVEVGAIPSHWTVKRLKFLGDIRSGIAKGKDHAERDTVSLPYLRVANVQDGYVDLREILEIEVGAHEVDRYRLHVGDVLMNEGGDNDKLGRGAVWGGQIDPCVHQNHVFAVRLYDTSLATWVSRFTSTAAARTYFFLRSKQSTNLASINQSNVRELPVPMPPEKERAAILAELERATTASEALVSHARSHIERLREYRASLISAAVTGQLDISAFKKAA